MFEATGGAMRNVGAKVRFAVLAALTALVTVPSPPARGQLRPDEIAHRPESEAFLATAEVVGRVRLTGPGSVTEPWVLTLRGGGIERKALWKDVEGRPRGVLDCWRYEIAAYRLDTLLGLGMVPATVERRDGKRPGSCQLYAEDAETLRDRITKIGHLTPAELAVWRRGGYIQQAFDNLIGNSDRSQGNILLTPDWRWVLIDHSRAFRTEASYTRELPFTAEKFPGTEIMRELPRALVGKLRALDEAAVSAAVGPYLVKKEIRALMARRTLLLAWIDAEIARVGEDKFLY
jgi:hypothetical protein